jgi:hypothetical protein
MDIAALSSQNLKKVRSRIDLEVRRLGKDISYKRPLWEQDKMKGTKLKSQDDLGTFKSLLINASGKVQIKEVEGGKKFEITNTCIVPYTEQANFKIYDWFEDELKRYTVVDANNINDMNIYWLLTLSAELKEVQKYG